MSVTQVRCLLPFTSVTLLPRGFVASCHPAWSRLTPAGNVFLEQDFDRLWNGDKQRRLRAAVLADRLERTCNSTTCPTLLHDAPANLEEVALAKPYLRPVLEEIARGKTTLDTPPAVVSLANSGACNLRCVVCGSNERFRPADPRLDALLWSKVLPQILPRLRRLVLCANGEPFFRRDTRAFLLRRDTPDRCPDLVIDIITNGVLLDEALWERIAHNRFGAINVSIDAGTAETYARVRPGGSFVALRRNLGLISRLRREGRFSAFNLSCVVMKSNHRELADVVALAREVGCDRLSLRRVAGAVSVAENINLTRDLAAMAHIGRQLAAGVFPADASVDISEIADYRRLATATVGLGPRLTSAALGALLKVPARLYHAARFRVPAPPAVLSAYLAMPRAPRAWLSP